MFTVENSCLVIEDTSRLFIVHFINFNASKSRVDTRYNVKIDISQSIYLANFMVIRPFRPMDDMGHVDCTSDDMAVSP